MPAMTLLLPLVPSGNLMVGANCAGFLKVATAMMAQGITY